MLAQPNITHALTSVCRQTPYQSGLQLVAKSAAYRHAPAVVSVSIRQQPHLQPLPGSVRHFTSSPSSRLKDVFPATDSANIKTTEPAWPHPLYTFEQMNAVKVAHRQAKTWSDWTALAAIRTLRWGMDLATGYKHPSRDEHALVVAAALDKGSNNDNDSTTTEQMTTRMTTTPRYAMTARKYMVRNIFLESVAGVPGMVAGMLRHLHSMRRLKRDNGWIETLLEESYNERMHLLTFLKMAEPGPFMRLMVLAAQGVFFNAMFLAYLVSPATCHRFVGYLEEEAVLTYSREIADLDAGLLPEWETMPAPDIAVAYWKMPPGRRMMRDLLLYIRADEAKHREVNHTLGNLDQNNDHNPFVSQYRDPAMPHPSKSIEHLSSTGWERSEVI